MASERSTQVRIKNTFIDVDDDESEMARRHRKARSKTEPSGVVEPLPDEDDEEDDESASPSSPASPPPTVLAGPGVAVGGQATVVKNTFIHVDDSTPSTQEARRARHKPNRTDGAGPPMVPEDEAAWPRPPGIGEPSPGGGMTAGMTTDVYPPTPEATPYWTSSGPAASSFSVGGGAGAGASDCMQPMKVVIKNTFIDVDDEDEEPGVRQARRPRHKTCPGHASDLDDATDGGTAHGSEHQPHESAYESVESIDPSSVAVTSLTVPRMQVNTMTISEVEGYFRTEWVVDARKLKGTDKQIVSPPFEVTLVPGMPPFSFKMTLVPKTIDRGGASFKKAEGVGHVQMKCHTDEDELKPLDRTRIRVSVGNEAQDIRGPFGHSFYDNLVFNLPKSQADWDFGAAADAAALALLVRVDMSAQGSQ